MIPYDLDPSLHTTRPNEPALDDGCSPPRTEPASTSAVSPATAMNAQTVDPALWAKSEF